MSTLAVVGTRITRSMARTLRYLGEGYSRMYGERLDQPVDTAVPGQPKLRIVKKVTGKRAAG